MGKKRTAGEGAYRTELKHRRNITLTDTAWAILDRLATEQGLSKSEYLERLLRES